MPATQPAIDSSPSEQLHPPVAVTGTETIGLVQQFVERTGQLYSLPAVAAEVLRLTDQPQIDSRAIKKCIESDPALAARVLRVANSSLFGSTRQVTDLKQAMVLLGIRPLKILVLGFSLPKELFVGLEAEVLASYWRRALTKAVAAREICERFWRLPGDEAFFAGLVQDIGVLVLLQKLGDSYQKLLFHAQTRGGSLLECELDTLGFDHLVLSARLLAHWGLGADFCAAISVRPDERRIDELNNDEAKLPKILHLAHLIGRVVDQPHGSGLSELLAVGSNYCDLTYEDLQTIVEAVQAKVGEMAEALSLQIGDGREYVDLLVEAHERLAQECVATVGREEGRFDEKSLLQLTTDLRAEVARCARGQRRRPDNTTATISRATSDAGVQRTTTVSSEDGFEPVLESKLAMAIGRSRQNRLPLMLAIMEIDDFADMLVRLGPANAGDLIFELRERLVEWNDQCAPILLSDSRLALLLEDISRSESLQMARELLAKVRQSSNVSMSIGLATLDFAPKNYPARQLVEAALGCLSAAQLSGGNSVKSIAV